MHNLYPKQRRAEHTAIRQTKFFSEAELVFINGIRRSALVTIDIYTVRALSALRDMDSTPQDIERLLPEYRELFKLKDMTERYSDKHFTKLSKQSGAAHD